MQQDLSPVQAPQRAEPIILLLAGVMALIELGLQVGGHSWRIWAFNWFSWWPGLLGAIAQGLADPLAGFGLLTHPLIHGGIFHFGFNTLALFTIGNLVARVMGPWRFVGFFWATAIAGALLFALITPDGRMVGASGGLFGLLAVQKRYEFEVMRAAGQGWQKAIGRFALEMLVMNGLLWVTTGGLLAWEAHLGGFIAGWFLVPRLLIERGRAVGAALKQGLI